MTFAEEVKHLSQLEDNNFCVDCSTKNTQWASLSYGIFLCMDCASVHRGMGVRISVVKSINLDKWTEEGILRMKLGGNKQFKEYLIENEIISVPTTEKYKLEIVKEYKENLQEKIEEAMPNSKKAKSIRRTASKDSLSGSNPNNNFNSNNYTSNNSYNNNFGTNLYNQTYSAGYGTPTFSTSDLKSTVSSAFYKISDFVSENAVYLKDKSIQYGSKLNESVVKPGTAYLKEKGKSLMAKQKKEDEYHDQPVKNKKIDNPGKWD